MDVQAPHPGSYKPGIELSSPHPLPHDSGVGWGRKDYGEALLCWQGTSLRGEAGQHMATPDGSH